MHARDSVCGAERSTHRLTYSSCQVSPGPSHGICLAGFETIFTRYSIRAPSEFVYLGHSLRIVCLSSAEAIGVSRYRGNWFGGWSQAARTRELHYIDPSVAPTPAAYALLGWQLVGDFLVGAVRLARAHDRWTLILSMCRL